MATGIKTGTLKKWFDEKGFGFITPQDTGNDVFVHITAFDKYNTRKPKVGDTIYYFLSVQDGKTKAVDAKIKGVTAPPKPIRPKKPYKQGYYDRPMRTSKCIGLIFILLFIAGSQLYTWFTDRPSVNFPAANSVTTSIDVNSSDYEFNTDSQNFECDGRKHCSQMTSCAEATYFSNNCSGTKMDGDGDGVPCERQLCN